jgi:transposase InsO family protein
MPWKESDLMSLRREFVALAQLPGANVSALCVRYGISRKTGYKWLERGEECVEDRSRRPHCSPRRTTAAIEAPVLALRARFPDWGARKLKRYLEDRGTSPLPAVSTITAILRRHGLISEAASQKSHRWQRFEHSQPNALWQMDFKGHVAMIHGRCHPLTVLDDHSRFNLVLQACAGETLQTVQGALQQCFRRYGLPHRISCDNGPPWGNSQNDNRLTRLGAWLIRIGVSITHARPGHPQTNGKDERFHRTLNNAVLKYNVLRDLDDAQRIFDNFRNIYNHERPHEALGLDVPVSRYRPSERAYPEVLPPVEYDSTMEVRKVDSIGYIAFHGQRHRISRALMGQYVALQPHPKNEDQRIVYFCHQTVRTIDLRHPDPTE